MALREQFMVKSASGVSELKLTAGVGESILVKGIYVGDVADKAVVYIEKTTVGYFRVGGSRGNHLSHRTSDDPDRVNILDWLREKGVFNGYPLGEGQSLTVKIEGGATTDIDIVYELYDAGDISPDQPNGTNANEYLYINYGQPSAAPTAAGDVLINNSIIPVEFPQFPFGAVVPANTEMDLIAIAGTPAGRTSGTGANKAKTTYVKLVRERVVLFDEDRQGIPFFGEPPTSDGVAYGGKRSLIGDMTPVDRREPFMFPNPITFTPGEELNVYITTAVDAGSQNLTQLDLEIAFIFRVRRAG